MQTLTAELQIIINHHHRAWVAVSNNLDCGKTFPKGDGKGSLYFM
jgi:hypothetical protein